MTDDSLDDTLDTSVSAVGYTNFASPHPPVRDWEIVPDEERQSTVCATFWSLLMDCPFEGSEISGRKPKVQLPHQPTRKDDCSAGDDDVSTEVIYSMYSPTKRGQQPKLLPKEWTSIGNSRYPSSSFSSASSSIVSEETGDASYCSTTSNCKKFICRHDEQISMLHENDVVILPNEGARDSDSSRRECSHVWKHITQGRRRKEEQLSSENNKQYPHIASMRSGTCNEESEQPPRPSNHQIGDLSKMTKYRDSLARKPILGGAQNEFTKQKEIFPTKEPLGFEGSSNDESGFHPGPSTAEIILGQVKRKEVRKAMRPITVESAETPPSYPEDVFISPSLRSSRTDDSSWTYPSDAAQRQKNQTTNSYGKNDIPTGVSSREHEKEGAEPASVPRNIMHPSGRGLLDAGAISSKAEYHISLLSKQNGGHSHVFTGHIGDSPIEDRKSSKPRVPESYETEIRMNRMDVSDNSRKIQEAFEECSIQFAHGEQLQDERDDSSINRNTLISRPHRESFMKPINQRQSLHPTIARWRKMATRSIEKKRTGSQIVHQSENRDSTRKVVTAPLRADPVRPVNSSSSCEESSYLKKREMTIHEQVDLRTTVSLVDYSTNGQLERRKGTVRSMSERSAGGSVGSFDRRQCLKQILKFRVRDARSVC